MIYEKTGPSCGALRQGEIVSNLIQAIVPYESVTVTNAEVRLIRHPFTMVLTQDCDLEWDFEARQGRGSKSKLLAGVLFCEVIDASELHRRAASSREWEWMKSNRVERYQFLQKVSSDDDAFGEGLPEFGVDFKRYFTLPPEEVYKQSLQGDARRRCCLLSPYLQHFTSRFFFFQHRVALPEPHKTDPE